MRDIKSTSIFTMTLFGIAIGICILTLGGCCPLYIDSYTDMYAIHPHYKGGPHYDRFEPRHNRHLYRPGQPMKPHGMHPKAPRFH